MAEVGVTIVYGSKGAEKTKKDIENLGTSLERASKAISDNAYVVGAKAWMEIGQKAVQATKAFYDFAKAGSDAAGVSHKFLAFEKDLDGIVSKLQETAAEALANSGMFDLITLSLERFLPLAKAVGNVLQLLEPAFIVVGQAIKLANAPTQLLADTVEFLTDNLPSFNTEIENSTTAIERFGDKMKYASAEAAKFRSVALDNQIMADSVNAAFGERTQADLQAWTNRLESVELGTAEYSHVVESVASEILLMSSTESEYKANVKAVSDELAKRGRTTLDVSQKVYDLAKAGKEAFEVDNELDEINKKGSTTRKAVAQEVNFITEALFEMKFAMLDLMTTSERKPFDKLMDYLRGLEFPVEVTEIGLAFNTFFDDAGDSIDFLVNKLGQANEISGKFYRSQKAGQELAIGAFEASAKGIHGIINSVAEEGWFKAGLNAAMETGYGIATAFTNPIESISHFAAAAQFLIAQAFAGSKNGKGSSSSSKATGTSPGMGFSGSKTKNEQKSETLVIEVDGQRLGELATKGINKAVRYGQAQLSSNAVVKAGKRSIE